MSAELISSLLIDTVLIIVSITFIIGGKSLRDRKSSNGISASSNETSTGTALIVCGLLLLLTGIIKIAKMYV
tara:strand:- start:200 stop:415 length:216 start_codon:yes stop_codon:yes gene_type:complete